MNNLEECGIALPLTQQAYSIAEQFAAEQINSDKAEKVRLNTLAVYLVNNYLNLMGIANDPTGGNSWNPLMRMSADVADLEVTGLGYLECIPVAAPASSYSVPPEVWSDRIGYVVVQIDDVEREGTILGFTSRVENGSISQLESWDSLLVLLDRMLARSTTEDTVINLSQWLTGLVDRGWETIDDILAVSERNLTFSFRGVETDSPSNLRRGKVFHLAETNNRVIRTLSPSRNCDR